MQNVSVWYGSAYIQMYGAHRLKHEYLGLSNAHPFISSVFSLCRIDVILAQTLTSELTLPLAAIFTAT